MIEWVRPKKGVARKCKNDVRIVTVVANKVGKKIVTIYFNDDVCESVSSSDRVLVGYDKQYRRIYFATPGEDTVSISYKMSHDAKHHVKVQFTLPKNWPDEFIVGEYVLHITNEMAFVNLDEKLDV